MKSLITTVALVAGLVAIAGDASAKSAAYCNQVATNYVNNYTHPVGSAALGCGIGAALGSLLSKGNGPAAIGGCVAGGATGLVLSDTKRQELYDQSFNDCMYGSGGVAPQPIYVPPQPAPVGSATVSSTANVRTGPGTGYPVITQVYAGTTVSIGQCTPNWCAVGVPGASGWISRSLLY